MAAPVAIAFLHGGKQGGWVWDEVRAAIAVQAGSAAPPMVVLDVPGCGTKRGRDVAPLTLADVVDDLAGDLGRIDARVMLVGHSQAGTVLPRLAAARREQVAKLVYVTCSAPEEGQTLAAMLGKSLQGTNPDEVDWPLDPATHTPQQLFARMFCNDMDDAARAAFLARLGKDDWPAACATSETRWGYDAVRDIPASYVIALRDQILTPAWQERFAARYGATSISRTDAGHQLLQSRPHAVAEILLGEIKDMA